MKILASWLKKRALNEEAVNAYVEMPDKCPFCKSENISVKPFEEDEFGIAWRPANCQDCRKTWDEEWVLKKIYSDEKDSTESKEEEKNREFEERWNKR